VSAIRERMVNEAMLYDAISAGTVKASVATDLLGGPAASVESWSKFGPVPFHGQESRPADQTKEEGRLPTGG
jgi:hypothetical protein